MTDIPEGWRIVETDESLKTMDRCRLESDEHWTGIDYYAGIPVRYDNCVYITLIKDEDDA